MNKPLSKTNRSPNGIIKTYEYDENSNRTGFTLTQNNTVQMELSYTYDSVNRLAGVTDENDNSITYEYDENGNLINKNVNGVISSYMYNELNQVKEVTSQWQPNGIGTEWTNIKLAYDLSGNVVSEDMRSSEYSVTQTGERAYNKTFGYNGRNQLEQEHFTNLPDSPTSAHWYKDITNYEYDYAGNNSWKNSYRTLGSNTSSLHYKDEEITDSVYDGNNRITSSSKSIIDLQENTVYETTSYTYDNNGNTLTESLTKNGQTNVTASYTYDNFNMVTGVTNLDGTTAYEYGADGLRSSKTTNGVKTEYVWDGSVLAGEIYGETAAQKFTVTGSTEGIGIALRSTGDTAGVTVGVYPWLGSYGTSIAGTAVASEEIEIYADESDGVITLNNLPAGDYVLYVHSGYGGAGLELNSEGEGAYRDGAAIDGEYVYWLYDEYDSTAYAEKQAARGTGSSDAETNTTYVPITGGASAGVDKKYINGLSLELAVNDVADTQTYIKNHRGDVTALLNGQNLPIANYTYNAYGTEREESFTYTGYLPKWGGDINNIRYAGQYKDAESGNYYLRARYYDPGMGRFTQEDPALDGDNWYAYAGNNPIMYIDPSGEVYIIAWSYLKDKDNIGDYTDNSGNVDWDRFTQENAFARAAYTQKQRLIESGVPENEIDIQRIDSVSDLENTWNMWAGYDTIERLDVFSHGSNANALITPDEDSSAPFWNDTSMTKLNWSSGAFAVFHGCNTGYGENSIAQIFADIQGIETFGQEGESSFSYNPVTLNKIDPKSTKTPVYLFSYEEEVKGMFGISVGKKNNNGLGKSFKPR